MQASANRVAVATIGLVGLLAVGLLIARAAGTDNADTSTTAQPSPTRSSSAASPTSTPTPPTDLKKAVETAYLRQWEVYARAVRTLRPLSLDEVFTGRALDIVRREISRRVRTQTPSRVRVVHDITVRIIDQMTAVVDDRYVNHTVTIDPRTRRPTERDPNQIVHEVYTLKKVEGTWKVSAIVRQSVRPR